jgi:hypothetical protein
MDDIVRQAMDKWPNVPACYGWLGLDARGHWFMRDDAAQAQGAFDSGSPGAKGSRIEHEKLIEFINRNYAVDTKGQWYFQNGPQRVFVELEIAPWVWRIAADFSVQAHTGVETQCNRCLSDELGHVYLVTSLGLGLVHTLDVHAVAEALEAQLWSLEVVSQIEIFHAYPFVQSPSGQSMML